MDNMLKKQNTLMTHEACESKLRSVVRSSMHPYPGNWVAIGHAVVYYALAARKFSAGIKCRHCTIGSYLLRFCTSFVQSINIQCSTIGISKEISLIRHDTYINY